MLAVMKKLKALLLLPFIAFLQFCNIGKGFDFKNQNIDEIQYSYHDAAVPPPLQRNYTIIVKTESVNVMTNFHDSTFSCTPEKFNNILDLLESGNIRCDSSANDVGCPGGDGESLICSSKGKVVFSGEINYCGDKRSGSLKGNIEPAATAILKLVPDMESLQKNIQ
jgi:hypothetical protein